MIDRSGCQFDSGRKALMDAFRRYLIFCAALAAGLTPAILHAQPTAQESSKTTAAQSASFSAISQRAMAALDADKLDEAVPLLRKALALNPRWAAGWWSLGTTYYDQNRFAEASLAFEKVVALDPRHGTAHALLGLCQFELGEDDAALKNIEASKNLGTDVDPQLRDVIFYHEGVLLQRKGLFVAAQKPLASICLGGSASEDVMRTFGMAALHRKDRQYPAPGSEAEGAVVMVGQAACIAARKDFDVAGEMFKEAVEKYPDFPFIHFAFGRELVDAREIPAAVEQFKIEAAHNNDRVLALLQIAAAEYKVDSAAGLPYAQQAVELAPKVPFAHFLLGLLLMDTGDYAKAVPELEIAKNGMPKEPKVLWSLAAAYGHVGRTKDASRVRAEFLRLSQSAQPPTGSENPDVQVNTTDGGDARPNH